MCGLSTVTPRLWSTGSVGMAHGFSCCMACGVFPDQEPWSALESALEAARSPPGSEPVLPLTTGMVSLQEDRASPTLRQCAGGQCVSPGPLPPARRPRGVLMTPAGQFTGGETPACPVLSPRDTSCLPELTNGGHKSLANRIMRFNI